jgi:anti-sigma-K factor RskA
VNIDEPFDVNTPEGRVPHPDLGAYVLGGLNDDERDAFERALSGDARLRAEVDELSGLPDLLALAAQVDDDGLDDGRVATPVARPSNLQPPRPASRRTPWAVAVAASVALVIGASGGVFASRDRSPAPEQAVTFRLVDAASTTGAQGRADLFRRSDGVGVRLRLRGLEPTDAGSRYECWWVGANGRVAAGSFQVGPDGIADVRLTVAGNLDGSFRININRVTNGTETRVLTANVT